jgi:hypothetical protein
VVCRCPKWRVALPTVASMDDIGSCAAPSAPDDIGPCASRSAPEFQVPRFQLFYLRTGMFLEQQLRSTTFILDTRVSSRRSAQAFSSPQFSSTLFERIQSRRDRDAVQWAIDMLCELRTGLVTLVIRNIFPPVLCGQARFLFLVLYIDPGASTHCVTVDASSTCHPRLRPTLHVNWWSEVNLSLKDERTPRNKDIFGGGYTSDTTDCDQDEDAAHSPDEHRDPLELAWTKKLLAQDLLRRVVPEAKGTRSAGAESPLTSWASAHSVHAKLQERAQNAASFGRGRAKTIFTDVKRSVRRALRSKMHSPVRL